MIPLFKVSTSEDVFPLLRSTLESGMLGEGPRVAELCEKIQLLFDGTRLVALNSATSALTLALRLASVDMQDSVISTPFTMVATNCAIANFTHVIRWRDIDTRTLALDCQLLLREDLDNIKAIVLTLVGGIPPYDLDLLWRYCKENNTKLILDCAHALTTTYKGKHISQWADFCCFSTQSIKHLTTGDGGFLTCSDEKDYIRAEKLKWFGMSRIVPPGLTRLEHQMTSDIPEYGYKFHMNDIAAAIGLGNLKLALQNINRSREVSSYYQEAFADHPLIQTLCPPEESIPDWWVYGFLVEDRDRFIQYLSANGIASTPMWRRNDEYSTFKKEISLETMSYVADRIVFIPNGWWLTETEKQYIATKVLEFK